MTIGLCIVVSCHPKEAGPGPAPAAEKHPRPSKGPHNSAGPTRRKSAGRRPHTRWHRPHDHTNRRFVPARQSPSANRRPPAAPFRFSCAMRSAAEHSPGGKPAGRPKTRNMTRRQARGKRCPPDAGRDKTTSGRAISGWLVGRLHGFRTDRFTARWFRDRSPVPPGGWSAGLVQWHWRPAGGCRRGRPRRAARAGTSCA